MFLNLNQFILFSCISDLQGSDHIRPADEELKENLQEDDFAILVPIIKNDTKTVEVFLNHGVPVNLRIRNLTSSLLHLACQLKLPEMAKFLISKGADIKMKDSQGKIALDYLNSEKIIGELLNYDNYDLEI